MYGTFWTPEEEEQLKALYKKGLTYDEISKIMGKTRSQISGKCDRLGLSIPKKRAVVIKPRQITLPPSGWKP